jgi:hypothetical protein
MKGPEIDSNDSLCAVAEMQPNWITDLAADFNIESVIRGSGPTQRQKARKKFFHYSLLALLHISAHEFSSSSLCG